MKIFPPDRKDSVPGYALVSDTRDDAVAMWNAAVGSRFEPGSSSSIAFDTATDGVNYRFASESGGRLVTVHVPLSGSEFARFIERTHKVLYHVVLFGYFDANSTPTLLEPAEFHLYQRRVQVDDEFSEGEDVVRIEWTSLLGDDSLIVLGE